MNRKEVYHKNYYGRTIGEFDELDGQHKKAIDMFFHYTNLNVNRLLDVGCGDGNFSASLKEVIGAKEIYGIEVSNESVKLAKNKIDKVIQMDIDDRDFPFEDEFFDAIFAGSVVEYLFDVDHFLEEVYRTLKTNGVFVLTFPNLASLYNRIALLLAFQPFGMNISLKYRIGHLYEASEDAPLALAGNIRPFTLRSMKELLKIHEFTIVDIKGACANIQEYSSSVRRLIYFIEKLTSSFKTISADVVIAAKKREK